MPAQDSPAAEVVPGPGTPGTPGTPGSTTIDPEDPSARSPRVQVAAAVVAILLIVGVAFHLVFVGLHVAPKNQASREYERQTRDWIYPFFEQSWALFAPEPLSVNIRVNARVQYQAADGTVTESAWTDLTGDDVEHIRGNPFPSKADQNLLRRAWDFYTGSHNRGDESPSSGQAALAEEYLRRIVVKRMQADGRADGMVAVQLRAVYTPIAAPGSETKPATTTRELAWWGTRPDDFR